MRDHPAPGLELTLDARESAQVTELALDLARDADPARPHAVFREAPVRAEDLPARLRRALTGMRQHEGAAYAVLRGLSVDDAAIGPTPDRWGADPARQRTRVHEMQLALLGSALGELFGWDSQQDGAVVHDVLPLREYENAQINFASQEPIWWHTEDAFHAHRPDYVGLMCLRNPQNAATTVSCAAEWDLGHGRYDVLFEERFRQRPDQSHGVAGREPEPRAVLLGERHRPYVRVDPYYLQEPEDERAAAALRDFYAVVEGALRQVVLAPGEVLFVDNYRAVHGRKPFRARYDGRDRWLKRASVSRDLRHCWPSWSKESRQVLTGEAR
ncbi:MULTISPECIES: guanitoxin biosynthesis L-enduracididine beta-hydroxylase GntD [Streptomyces]|uniref:guanitoxin biosynthesis L-enduracididine beta-hydroxylase GntD n=1 Tax=Streptomyces TaxID=1883 RepID=UPI002249874B|nr:guanitoxin biosynthesis L-enduracididine beta-hydroxylase GntD [Streptomyces sp. JHD 1]MCX2969317.1 TauD/TfdA family dioxygenase [Streptomyces sp. JHD 1]